MKSQLKSSATAMHGRFGVLILVVVITSSAMSKEAWYSSADNLDMCRLMVAVHYFEYFLESAKNHKSNTDSDSESSLSLDKFEDYTRYTSMIESPFDSSHFHVYSLNFGYSYSKIGEYPICAVTRDSVWVLASPIMKGSMIDYASRVDYLLKVDNRVELSSEEALEITMFAFELVRISAAHRPCILSTWQDIFGCIWTKIPDSANASNDAIYSAIRPPEIKETTDGYEVTIYWWTSNREVHRARFNITPNSFSVTDYEMLGLRGGITKEN